MTAPRIPGGYIVISRKIIESEIWEKPPLYVKVWLYLLTRAQHKDYKSLSRGQLRTSLPEIAEACSWYVGYRKVTPTKDQIYQVIDWLRKPREAVDEADGGATMITTTKATQAMIVTIDKYDLYQDKRNYESNTESNNENDTGATREQRQPNNINKNDKNGNNDNKEIKKRPKQVYDESSLYYKMAQFFYELIQINNPNHKQPNMQRWSDDIRKLVEIDHRDKDEVGKLMKWVQRHDFWQANVLSPSKLRDKYDQLLMQYNQDNRNRFDNVAEFKPREKPEQQYNYGF